MMKGSSYARLFCNVVTLVFLGLTAGGFARADIVAQSHGFLSQAYIKTNTNNFFGVSEDNGSIDLTEVGLNGSVRLLTDIQASAQLLFRNAGKSDEANLKLDFAVIDYQLFARNNYYFGIRAGRIKNPFGLFNETRDVAFTRPGIILPQSIYFDRVRDFALSSDGGQVYGFYSHPYFDLEVQLEAAIPKASTESEIALFKVDLPGKFNPQLSYIGRVVVELFNGRLKLGYSDVRLNIDYDATALEPISNAKINFNPKIYSLQYTLGNFEITSEYADREFNFVNMAAYVPNATQIGQSYYIQGLYHILPSFRTFIRYDVVYLNKEDKNGKNYEQLTSGLEPAFTQYAKDYTVGIQWNISQSWLFMLEQHWVNGVAWLPVQDNPVRQDLEKQWWMFNALISYRF